MLPGAESDGLHLTGRDRRLTAAAAIPDGGSLRADGMGPRLASVADNTAHYYGSYLPLLVILVVGTVLVVAMFTSNRLLRPTFSTPEKLLTYECGVDPVGEGWAQNHVRYYVFAYLYVIFAVDAVFLFPWATVFDGLGWVSVGEMGVFIGFIAVGLVYAWRKGVLTWT